MFKRKITLGVPLDLCTEQYYIYILVLGKCIFKMNECIAQMEATVHPAMLAGC